jgi:predicted GH43/DUF377 family glycosyl hydrolase
MNPEATGLRVKLVLVLALVGSALIMPSLVRADSSEWIEYSGNPVLSPTPGSWDATKILQPQVVYTGNSFRMWYVGRNQTSVGIGYATSPDGFIWTKYPNPVLLPGPSSAWDSSDLGLGEVAFNGTAFLMWYRGTSPIYPGGAFGLATSTDGVTWVKYARNPILAPSSVDSKTMTTPGVTKVVNAYYMWYSARNDTDLPSDTLKILFAQSNDGMNWARLSRVVLSPSSDPQSWDSLSLYCASVIYDGITFGMWYSALSQSAITPRIGYATSSDGLTWTKFPSNPILNLGASGSWDSNGVEEPTVIATKSGYMLYYDGLAADMSNRIGVAQSPQGFVLPEFSSQTVVNLLLATLLLTTTFLIQRHTKSSKQDCLLGGNSSVARF